MTSREAFEELKSIANGATCTLFLELWKYDHCEEETLRRRVYIAGLPSGCSHGEGDTWEAALSDIRAKIYLSMPVEPQMVEDAYEEMDAMGGTQ